MLQELETYIKLAVNMERSILAERSFHADAKRCCSKMGANERTSGVLTGILIQRRWPLGFDQYPP